MTDADAVTAEELGPVLQKRAAVGARYSRNGTERSAERLLIISKLRVATCFLGVLELAIQVAGRDSDADRALAKRDWKYFGRMACVIGQQIFLKCPAHGPVGVTPLYFF